jgi:hypothetical protein
MQSKSMTSFSKESSSRLIKRAVMLALLCGAMLALLTALSPRGRAHDPVTTTVRFNKDIVRIFQRNCLGCHSENGIAQIPLTSHAQARPWAKAIKEEILEKRMPPYQAVKGFGRFRADYALSQREMDLIISWVEGGAPKGEDKDLPRDIVSNGWKLGQPDLILQPKSEAELSAESSDEHRCFTLPTGLTEDRWIRALDFQPGNGAVVHCASFAISRGGVTPVTKTANQSGGDCGGNGDTDIANRLGEWVPGQTAMRWPAGVGRLLPAGARVTMRIHYRQQGEAARDRSALALYFANEPITKPLHGAAIIAPATEIPPGAAHHRVTASYTLPEAVEALAIRPLLYPFAQSIEAAAYRPDGKVEVLILARNYRSDWQPAYYFKQPIALPKGTRIELTAYLDNSDRNPKQPHRPPRPLRLTEALGEIFFTHAAPRSPTVREGTLMQVRPPSRSGF